MSHGTRKSKRLIGVGARIGRLALTVAETILIGIAEEMEDMEYIRTHCYAVIGKDVRSARYESEEAERLHELKMRHQAMKRLVEEKLVRVRREGNKVVYMLTADGEVKAIKTAIRRCSDYFFDDRICLVSFDIPEAARKARSAFRRFLKSAGFRFVQGSVWSIKKNVARDVRALVSHLKIERWVEIYEARR